MAVRTGPAGKVHHARGRRKAEVQRLLDSANAWDEQADVRDSVAAERDGAAALQSLDPASDYEAVLETRRSAALDRTAAKGDRLSAADDRSNLAAEQSPSPSPDED